MKKRTSNIERRTSNAEVDPRLRGDDRGTCEDCRFSMGSVGRSERILTCLNKAGAPGRMWVVEADQYCANFTQDKELLEPELVQALAAGAKLIPLTQDRFAIVDAEDYDRLCKYKWHVKIDKQTCYASGTFRNKGIRMHRKILNAPRGLVVDHINYNGLDNRKQNLRLCTFAQNCRNRRPIRRAGKWSRHKGVSWDKAKKRFVAYIRHNGKFIRLGRFKSEIAAAKAYDKKARELFGEYAYLNFPQDYGLPSRTS